MKRTKKRNKKMIEEGDELEVEPSKMRKKSGSSGETFASFCHQFYQRADHLR